MFNPTKNKFNLTRFASRLADDSWPVILVPLHQSSSTFILYIEQQSTVHLSCTLYSRVQYIYPVNCTVEYSTSILHIVQQCTVHLSCTLYSSVQYIYPVHCTVEYSTAILYIIQQRTEHLSCCTVEYSTSILYIVLTIPYFPPGDFVIAFHVLIHHVP